MGVTVLIPARLGSSRFPGKVLAAETGRPLIQHVYESAAQAPGVDRVVVATEDTEVIEACRAFGGESVLTGRHENGTSRLAEAASLLGLSTDHVVVNVQGDEPELEPAIIGAAASMVGPFDCGTVATPITRDSEAQNPNVVKALIAPGGRALCFSRATVPHDRDRAGVPRFRHVGIYAYTAGFLAEYAAMVPTPLEQAERLEQLRILEHGRTIGIAVRASSHAGIDTPEQYAAFVKRWRAMNSG
ncbi:MAG: 3-deoxy-manno-octulosonate cytidylyltransferase [Planctomycetota bacterium]